MPRVFVRATSFISFVLLLACSASAVCAVQDNEPDSKRLKSGKQLYSGPDSGQLVMRLD